MRLTLAALNVGLGLVYVLLGVIFLIDLKRGWRTMGYSHLGVAMVAMAFTCGPHHLEHGLHLALAGRPAGPMEVLALVVGLPPAAFWAALRLEALAGGRGDRFVGGTPRWLAALPQVFASYALVVGATLLLLLGDGSTFDRRLVPNVVLIGMYGTIASYLLRTQRANRASLGGWSVSGLSLTGLFSTCAVMHATWLAYAVAGTYDIDGHGVIVSWLSVPAALYFLWVVRALWLGTVTDWNHTATGLVHEGLAEETDPLVAA